MRNTKVATKLTKLKIVSVSFLLIVVLLFLLSLLFNNSSTHTAELISTNNFLMQDVPEVHEAIEVAIDSYFNTEDTYDYTELFKQPIELCKQNIRCRPELVFPYYLEELVHKAQSLKQVSQAITTLGIVNGQTSTVADFDNDGEDEIALLVTDNLNRAYSTLHVLDQNRNTINLFSEKFEPAYGASSQADFNIGQPVMAKDLTGDAIPEILLFLSGARGGSHLYILTYTPGSLRSIFDIGGDYKYISYSFTNQNQNRISEILLRGVKYKDMCEECSASERIEVFEYDPVSRQFVQFPK